MRVLRLITPQLESPRYLRMPMSELGRKRPQNRQLSGIVRQQLVAHRVAFTPNSPRLTSNVEEKTIGSLSGSTTSTASI